MAINGINGKHICFAKGGFMNVKLPLLPKYCLSIYFCYNTLHVIVPNLTGGQGKRESEEKETGKTHCDERKKLKDKHCISGFMASVFVLSETISVV